jgi:hypothetical protein
MEMQDDGIRFPAIAERHYKYAIEAFSTLTEKDKAEHTGESEDAPRYNASRMRFIENAAMAVIAYAAALEAQIVLVGISLYGRVCAQYHLEGNPDDLAGKLAKLFISRSKRNVAKLPFRPDTNILTGQAKDLHEFGHNLVDVVLGGESVWPKDSDMLLADLRNHLIHRTVEVISFKPENTCRPTTIKMLEDWNPDDLNTNLLRARETFCTCWNLMQQVHRNFYGREIEVCEAVLNKYKFGSDKSS